MTPEELVELNPMIEALLDPILIEPHYVSTSVLAEQLNQFDLSNLALQDLKQFAMDVNQRVIYAGGELPLPKELATLPISLSLELLYPKSLNSPVLSTNGSFTDLVATFGATTITEPALLNPTGVPLIASSSPDKLPSKYWPFITLTSPDLGPPVQALLLGRVILTNIVPMRTVKTYWVIIMADIPHFAANSLFALWAKEIDQSELMDSDQWEDEGPRYCPFVDLFGKGDSKIYYLGNTDVLHNSPLAQYSSAVPLPVTSWISTPAAPADGAHFLQRNLLGFPPVLQLHEEV